MVKEKYTTQSKGEQGKTVISEEAYAILEALDVLIKRLGTK